MGLLLAVNNLFQVILSVFVDFGTREIFKSFQEACQLWFIVGQLLSFGSAKSLICVKVNEGIP